MDKTYYFVYIAIAIGTCIAMYSCMCIITAGKEVSSKTQEQVDIKMKENLAYEISPSRIKMTENQAYSTLPMHS